MPLGRIPAGLTFSLCAAAVSVGTIVFACDFRWPTQPGWVPVIRSAAALSLFWALLSRGLHAARPHPARPSTARDLGAVLQVAQMVMALLAIIIMLYWATMGVLTRIPSLRFYGNVQIRLWSSGLIDLLVVGVGAWLGWHRSRNHHLLTALFWLSVFAALWAALQIPELREVRSPAGIAQAEYVDWVSPFALGSALAILGFTIAGGVMAHRRRVRAWPDALQDLTTPAPEWPGFRYSAGIVAVTVMVLGCVFIVSPWTPFAALMAGGAMLALANRRWNENLADAGLGLITLGVVSLLMTDLAQVPGRRAEYFASVFNRALLGLGIMTGFWHWLPAVWKQQLDNGKSWTTAGRMIRPCHRVGFLLGATGLLVAIHLALWPAFPYVDITDASTNRWVWGLIANGALILSLLWSALKTGKTTLAWLTVLALTACIGFVVTRSTGSAVYSPLMQFWPLIMATTAGAALLLADRARRARRWQPFLEPLYFLGILINPVVAVLGTVRLDTLSMPLWVPSVTFGVLAGVYALAAILSGPRSLFILTVICAGAGLWHLRLS